MEPDDEQHAGEVLHRRGRRKAFTVQEMVDQWSWLVGEVEDGYSDLVDAYVNDLYSRNWLHEAWPVLTERAIIRWTPQVRALDDRFRAATTFDDGICWAQFHRISRFDPVDMWWWRRHPRLLVGHFGRSLRAAGASD
ncbi:hypothetical protein ACGFYY_08695 [Streptomyces sp. NPDC048331]|uniref:hypothetical protein n=1 Tax=Streptomyces sp. NPDC048331 TaxID=3365534 RepID=UPI0037140F43